MSAETLTLKTSARLRSFVLLRSHFLDHHNADTIHFVFFLGGGGGEGLCAFVCLRNGAKMGRKKIAK